MDCSCEYEQPFIESGEITHTIIKVGIFAIIAYCSMCIMFKSMVYCKISYNLEVIGGIICVTIEL